MAFVRAIAALAVTLSLGCGDSFVLGFADSTAAGTGASSGAGGGAGGARTSTTTSSGGATTASVSAASTGAGGAGGTATGPATTSGCGPMPMCSGNPVDVVVPGVPVFGDTANGTMQLVTAGCGGTDGWEQTFALIVTQTTDLIISTDFPETPYDAVLYVRYVCDDDTTELDCNDDGNGDTIVIPAAAPGTYFIIVDSHGGASGQFKLLVTAS